MPLPPAIQSLFADALVIPANQVTPLLRYSTIPQWDSVAHMQLVMKLEKHFGVMMEPEDILDLSSPAKAVEILTRLGVKLDA